MLPHIHRQAAAVQSMNKFQGASSEASGFDYKQAGMRPASVEKDIVIIFSLVGNSGEAALASLPYATGYILNV